MKTSLYVIHDAIASESGPVFEAKNDAVAMRALIRLLATDNINRNEFSLLHVGDVDHDTNVIEPKIPARAVTIVEDDEKEV